MPSEFRIDRVERHCRPCDHLKFENAIYGHDFVRGNYVCHHPEAHEFDSLSDDPKIAAKQGELRASISKHGRFIGKKDTRPTWCPLLRTKDPLLHSTPAARPSPTTCAVCGGLIRKRRIVFDDPESSCWEHIGEKLSHTATPRR